MTAPVAVLPVPRPKITKSYDQRTVEQSFQSLERDLQQKFDRRGDLILDPGKELVLTADGSAAQYGIGIDITGYLRILNYADGSIGTFSVAWAQVDGAQQEITNLTTYVDAADATLQANINTVATTSATNGTAISTLQTEITAAREGEASLLANITDVRTAFAAADAAEASARLTLQANLEAADSTLQANIDAEESARVTADTAEAASRTALEARVEGPNPNLVPDGGFENGGRGWTLASGASVTTNQWGAQLQHPTTGGTHASSIDITQGISAGVSYTLSADFVAFASSGDVYCDVLWLDSGGLILLDDDGPVAVLGQDFSNRKSATLTAPSGAVTARLRFVTESISGATAVRVRKIKFEVGTEQTAWTDEATATQTNARIETEEVARATADSAEAAARTALQATLESADSTLQSNIDSEASTRASADSTAATDRTAIRSEFAAADTTLQANIDAEASTRATADAAEAAARSTLTARVGGAEAPLTKNAFFQEDFSTGLPPEWSEWANVTAFGSQVTRTYGDGFALSVARTAGFAAGVLQDVTVVAGNKYLLSGEIVATSGDVVPSGIYVEWFNATPAIVATSSIAFATEASTSGVTSSTPAGVVRWEKELTAPAAVFARIYAMSGWSGFGSVAGANTLTWRECNLTPVSNAQAQTTINAASIVTEASARATADTAEASARETLSASLRQKANLIPNPTGNGGADGWTAANGHVLTPTFSPFWGQHIAMTAAAWTGFRWHDSDLFPVAASTQYTFSVDYAFFASGGSMYIEILEYDGTPTLQATRYAPTVSTTNDFSDDLSDRASVTFTTTSSTTQIKIRVVTNAPTGVTFIGWRKMQLELGDTVTEFTSDKRVASQSAATEILREAFVDSSGNAYAGIRLVAAASGGTPAIIELKSGDGTADVRLGGDTEIDGNLVVNGTIQTEGIVANGVTEVSSDSTDAAIALSDNTWTDVASVAVTVAAGETIKLEGSAFFEASYSGGASGSGNVACDYRLVRDSTVLRTQDATNYVALAGVPGSILSSGRGLAIVMDTDAPGAGSYTYKLQANITLNGVGPSATTRDVSNRLLIVTRLKR